MVLRTVQRSRQPRAKAKVRRSKVCRHAQPLRAGFPRAEPGALGVSASGLDKIRIGTKLEVRTLGSIAGAAHIVLRRGKCIYAHADGWANKQRGVRFGFNTICYLHGSTKSVVAAAFMTLIEDGLVKLDDPVSKFMPFSARVAVGNGGRSRPAKTLPTVRHLLTMSAGLLIEDCPAYAGVMRDVSRGKLNKLASFCDAIAEVPLQFEPGSKHSYSFCTDFVGRLCEVISGQDLESFVTRKILRPLGMRDTHFNVPAQKRSRCAVLYECKPLKRRRVVAGKSLPQYQPTLYTNSTPVTKIMSAGGGISTYKDAGLFGTIKDYARFCQMFLNGGRASGPGGARVLKASTMDSIWHDGLSKVAPPDGRLPGWHDSDGPPWEGGAWDEAGFSHVQAMACFLKGPRRGPKGPPRRATMMGLGGGGGTYWNVDAKRQMVQITFSQSFAGGRTAGDGLGPPGNDCVDISTEAADAGRDGAKKTRGRRN